MSVRLRPALVTDADACGEVIFAAFKGIDERHGFPNLFTSARQGAYIAKLFTELVSMHGIVAEDDGRVVGAVFLDVGDPINSVGLISVDPAAQRRGIGRQLMEAAIAHAGDARGLRLVQEAFNTHAMGLYASLGFEAKEPLVVVAGQPRSRQPRNVVTRLITPADLDECGALCRRVHGVDRNVDLQDAMRLFLPTALVRDGRIAAYSYIVSGGSLAWGVAETHDDLETLLLVLAASASAPLRFNLPTRDARLFRWCLDQGMRIERPLTLMARGWYQEPRGPYFPSGFY